MSPPISRHRSARPSRGAQPVSLSNNLGTIKDNRAEMRVSFEQTTSEMAVPTGYIAKCTDAGQIEVRKRGNDHFGLHRRVARHGRVEHLAIPCIDGGGRECQHPK